jgi:hypothetical protein
MTGYGCYRCGGTPLCDACVARWVEVHCANVSVAGRAWARQIIGRSVGSTRGRAWPAFESSERLRIAALEKVAPFAGADPRTRYALARICADAAGAVYEAWRAGVAGGVAESP